MVINLYNVNKLLVLSHHFHRFALEFVHHINCEEKDVASLKSVYFISGDVLIRCFSLKVLISEKIENFHRETSNARCSDSLHSTIVFSLCLHLNLKRSLNA
eukprot:NODE_692_length_5142_cov_0.116597.p5 type:complete len:101 gc:universal NODE_692_length_5142_cov_0.116597:2933-3235(+)